MNNLCQSAILLTLKQVTFIKNSIFKTFMKDYQGCTAIGH